MRKYLIGLTFITMLFACSEEGALPGAKQKSKLFMLFEQDLLNFRSGNPSSFSTIGTDGFNFSDPFNTPGSAIETKFIIDGVSYTIDRSFCYYISDYDFFMIGGIVELGDDVIEIRGYTEEYPKEGITYTVGEYSNAFVGIAFLHQVGDEYFIGGDYYSISGFVDFDLVSDGISATFNSLTLQDEYSYETIQAEGELQCNEVVTD